MGPTPNRTPPRLHLAVLCSYVELDGNDQPFALVEPMYGVAVLSAADGRLPAPDLDVYVQLDDEHAAGAYWFSVQVRRDDPLMPAGRVIPGGQTPPAEVGVPGAGVVSFPRHVQPHVVARPGPVSTATPVAGGRGRTAGGGITRWRPRRVSGAGSG